VEDKIIKIEREEYSLSHTFFFINTDRLLINYSKFFLDTVMGFAISKKKKEENESSQIPKKFTRRFNKIKDPYFSLFDNEYKSFKFMRMIMLIFLGVGLVFFPIGLTFTIRGNIILGVPLLTFGSMFIMMLMYLPIHLLNSQKFKTILPLKEKKQIDELLQLATKHSQSYGFLDQEKAKLATYVLIDLKSRDLGQILLEKITHSNRSQNRQLLREFHLLALKLGYVDHIGLYKSLIIGEETTDKSTKEQYQFDREVVVPITKVYFLDAQPPDAKCMISGLKLDFKKETVVTCPFCNAWAKKDLLMGWLKEKEKCPVCSRKLTIDDCPEVKIQ